MKLTMPFKEIYIRLAEGEPGLVCTIRYGVLGSKVTRFPVQAGIAEMEEEAISMVWPRKVIPRAKPL